MIGPVGTSRAIAEVERSTGEEVEVLPRSHYWGAPKVVARNLLGAYLVSRTPRGRGPCQYVGGRIVEVEAYLGETDPACHASHGLTERTRIFYEAGGVAYVFYAYGIHRCFNVITGPEGTAGCVLVRALEPVLGIRSMRRNRGSETEEDHRLCSGPGKLSAALGIGIEHNGLPVTEPPLVVLHPRKRMVRYDVGPRVGISQARDWPLRYTARGSDSISVSS